VKTPTLLLALLLAAPLAFAANPESYEHYLHGLLAERKGDLATALSDYRKAVELDANATEVYRDLAQLNLRTGRTEDALHAAQRVRDLAPKEASSFLFLGHVHFARGDLSMAAQAYEKALQLEPKNLRALENLGDYYARSNPKKAMEYYKRYLDIEPRDAEIYFQMGTLNQKGRDFAGAITAYKKSIQYDPQQVASHLALAELYELRKSTQAAIEQYEACEQLDPRNPAFYSRLGRLYFENKQWDEAASQFQNAKTLEPQNSTNYYYLARIAEERQQWPEAGKLAEEAYRLSRDTQFLPLLAYYLTMQRRTREAVTWLEKARKADPENPNVLLFLGMDYLELDKPAKARDILQAGAGLHPTDVQLNFQLGIAFDRLKQFDQAVKQFEQVLRLDPKNAATLNYLGYSYADRGIKLVEAEKLVRQAVDLDRTNGAYWDSLGWVFYKQGKFPEAVHALQQAILYSQEALIYEHLGDAYQADQKLDRATGAWAKALALDPKNKAVEKKMEGVTQSALASANQRKVLKYIEGNFRQISNLQGLVQVTGRLQKTRLKTQGGVYYMRPDRFLLAIGASAMPAARVSVKGQSVQIQPREIGDQWGSRGLEGLTWLPIFFSGRLLTPLDNSPVNIDSKRSALHYKGASEEAWVDPRRGVLVQYIRKNPQGGNDVISIDAYDLVEGLWLPKEMVIENKEQKWQARLQFSNWQINEPQTAQAFDSLQP
jgi:tetratricopeptide (TPR) repeat protein